MNFLIDSDNNNEQNFEKEDMKKSATMLSLAIGLNTMHGIDEEDFKLFLRFENGEILNEDEAKLACHVVVVIYGDVMKTDKAFIASFFKDIF